METQEPPRWFITWEEAVRLLPEGEDIHVQYNDNYNIFLGADWSRDEVVDSLKKAHKIEIGGPMCRALGHGLCIWQKETDARPAFVSHNEELLQQLEATTC